MSCPGDDAIVSFMQGTVGPSERARIEEHLDVCPACTALLAGLGRAFGQENDAEPERDIRVPDARMTTLLVLQTAMALLHTFGAVIAGPPLANSFHAFRSGSHATFDLVVLALGAWTYAGLPWAWANVRALRRRSRHAARSVRLFSVLATLSLFATPFALHAIYLLARPDVRGRAARGPTF